MRYFLIVLTITMFLLVNSSAIAGEQILPSEATVSALKKLEITKKSTSEPRESLKLTVNKESISASNRGKFEFNSKGSTKIPFIVPNTMIIQLSPNLTAQQLKDLINDKNLCVLKTFPNTGQIQVEADLSKYFEPKLSDSSKNATILRGAVEASIDFKKDPRILGATPDVFLQTQVIANLSVPSNVFETVSGESIDWGIVDIEADKVWSEPGAQNGVIFGVMDAGFKAHEDIIFSDIPEDMRPSDHGNHVSGIACGRHDNNVGIKGVLPHCFVRPRIGSFHTVEDDGGAVLQFYVQFSQILATLNSFIPTRYEIKTYNISLGYNWMPNFAINPDDSDTIVYRQLVQAQGEQFLSILKLADEKGKIIFSAAGNDSTDLSDPIDSKYASPFNWAAIVAREREISRNGVIVESHNQEGKRSSFSNEKGHISCPGENILSAIASSEKSYGMMSGTSMASPYCAAAHSLMSLVRPKYSGMELVACMTDTSLTSDSGAPRLKLMTALQKCPKR